MTRARRGRTLRVPRTAERGVLARAAPHRRPGGERLHRDRPAVLRGAGARKVVVMVSPGFPRAENVPIYRDYDFFLDTPVGLPQRRSLGTRRDLASELEYTLYALDPSGSQLLDAESEVDASAARRPTSPTWRTSTVLARGGPQGQPDQGGADHGRRGDLHRDAAAALADVERLTSSYYSLGYQPEHVGDGKESRDHGRGRRSPGLPADLPHQLRRPAVRAARRRALARRPAHRRDRQPARRRAGARQAQEQVQVRRGRA